MFIFKFCGGVVTCLLYFTLCFFNSPLSFMTQLSTTRVNVIFLFLCPLSPDVILSYLYPYGFKLLVINQCICFPVCGSLYKCLFCTIIFKIYLDMNDLGIMWYTMKLFLYPCMYVLRWSILISMHICLVPEKDTIMFHWMFTFSSYTIKVIIFPG